MANDPQRDFALQVVRKLRAAGHDALWAGGCVRDQLLGVPPKDYDIATDAKPEEVREVFGKKRTIPVGVSFGVVTVLGPKQAGQIEVATFRTDGGYSDGRHPDRVEFATPQLDAQRRDFTINGLFYDPTTDTVLDFVGGEQDLQRGILRAIGDPAARIAEDKLRMLRAVRFAARFELSIDPATHAAICEHASEIVQVSGERIGAEMRAMLLHPHRANALDHLRESGLEPYVFGELADARGEERAAMLALIDRLEDPSLGLVLAAILTSLQPQPTLHKLVSRWKLPNRDADLAGWLIEKLPVALAARSTPWPVVQRVLIHDGAGELVDLASAILGTEDAAVTYCREKLALPETELNPAPLLTGDVLIAAGLKPGAHFGYLLEKVRDEQLMHNIESTHEAIQLAMKLAN